jgi:hypothetical protein
MLVMDTHANILALRQRYGKARVMLGRHPEANVEVTAMLTALQAMLESLSPQALGMEPIQGVLAAGLRVCKTFGCREETAEYSRGVWGFLVAQEVKVKEPLKDILYELA